jgi:hypothetical protein
MSYNMCVNLFAPRYVITHPAIPISIEIHRNIPNIRPKATTGIRTYPFYIKIIERLNDELS